MPVLLVEKGPSKGTKVKLKADSEVVVGTGAGATLILKDPLIAAQQLAITGADGAWWISDIGDNDSVVFLNGEQLEEETALRPGDQIEVGETLLSFTPDAESKKVADPLVGTKVGGYEIVERVGRGGMGVVYKAVQLSLNREVALKLLAKKYVQDKNFINMFVEEARSAAAMNHPNIVQAYDVGKAGESYYFSMEYMAGGSIQDILAKEDKVEPGRACAMLIGAAKGLEFAEKKKIVHCDIKPDNLMLTEEGAVKIGDLGLSKNLSKGGNEGDTQIFGTPHFVAPEQVQGKPLDHRTDLYSLGASFFRIISGRTPFTGETARELVMKHLKEDPPSLMSVDPEIPKEVDDVIQKLMKKDPSDRYQSAGDLVGDVRKAMLSAGLDAGGYTDLIPGIAGGGKKSKTGMLVGIGVAVLAVIIAIIVVATSGPPEKTPEQIEAERIAEQKRQDELKRAKASAEENTAWNKVTSVRLEKRDDAHPDLEQACREFLAKFPKGTWAEEAQKLLDAMPGIRKSRGKAAVSKDWKPLARLIKDTNYDNPDGEKRLKDFVAKFPDSKEAKQAQAYLDRAAEHRASLKQREDDAAAALAPVRKKAEALAGEDRWGEALTAVAAFDLKAWKGTKAADDAASLKAKTEGDAGKRFLQLSKEAKQKESGGDGADLDGAITAWQYIVDRWGIPGSVELAKKEIARIESRKRDLAKQAHLLTVSAEMEILRGVDAKAREHLAELQFKAAHERYTQLEADGRITTKEVQKELADRLQDYMHAQLAMKAIVSGCAAHTGKSVVLPEKRFNSQKAKITAADDQRLSATYTKGRPIRTSAKWVEFAPAELLTVAVEHMPGGSQSNIQRGVLAMLWGLAGDAEREFEAAKRDPGVSKLAGYYLKRLATGGLVDAKAEAAAQQLRDRAEALIHEARNTRDNKAAIERLREAEALLEQLKAKYPGTKAAKGE
ncbi:MAG: protein kinase domain-containing protein [Planctomycetota bacterium]|jgi:hypothetical protein